MTKIGPFPNFQQLKSNIKTRITIRVIVRAVWRMSETFKSKTINHKKNFMILSHLASFWGVFPKASQDWKVTGNLMSPFDIIFFKFPCDNWVAKPVVSYSKVKIFRCCLQKMMAGCRILGRHCLGRNLQI